MIYYLVDLLINNLNIYISALILIKINDNNKFDMFLILLIDIFFNKIPIIFLTLLCLKYLNKLVKKFLSKSFLVDNIIYIFNYVIFMMVIFVYQNNGVLIKDLFIFLAGNFLVNYLVFLLLKLIKWYN